MCIFFFSCAADTYYKIRNGLYQQRKYTTESKHYDHSQMKQIMLIILLQWCMSRSGIYWTVSEQSVLIVDVLEVGEISRREDLSGFDKSQIIMAR